MTDSLYSASWYRVADLRPRLRSHARIHRHVYRGEIWYVLQDQSTGRFHRFTPVANLLIGLMDGTRTLQQIWDAALSRLGNDVPPQDEVIKLLSDLHRADVLQSNVAPDLGEMDQRRNVHARARSKQDFGNPLSLRFALLDPDKLLDRVTPALRWMAGLPGLLLWLCVVGYGAALGAEHWGELSSGVLDRIFIFHNLVLMALLFPVVKILHEFGHAVAIKLGGGEVHEMGLMLLVLMPIPYVDASSASAFQSKRLRMLSGAAGILVELFIAAIALVAWAHLEPGLARAIAYDIFLITGISTIIFNGNPLLRYDGYYILADYLEIPNLGQRANDYLGYVINRYLFGVASAETSPVAAGERRWFVFYALASFAYRMFVTFSIVLMIAGQFFVVGVVLALWCCYTMIVLPLVMKIGQMVNSPQLRTRRLRVMTTVLALTVATILVVAVVPMPFSTSVQGIVWAPEDSQVRASVDGTIQRVLAAPMALVRRGDPLFECDDPVLLARVRQNQAALDELAARYDAVLPSNRVQAAILEEQIVQSQEALKLSQQRLEELIVRSPADGVFIIDTPQDAPGKYVQRGDLIAYVDGNIASEVRVVLPQEVEERVRTSTRRVTIRAAENMGKIIPARIVREVPAATDQLPSVLLSLQGGGNIGVGPNSQGDNRAIERLFVMDLELPFGVHLSNLGSRIYVRFDHAPEPLMRRWYRGMRRLLLKRFNV